MILSGTFLFVLVLSEFGLLSILPFWDPKTFCHWAHNCLGPPVGYLLVFIPVFSRRGRRLFGGGSNVRYVHLIELIFGFPIIFISC